MGMNISEITHVGIEPWLKRNTEVQNSLSHHLRLAVG